MSKLVVKPTAKTGRVSLNIKVSHDLDFRLKRARAAAREQGGKFNVAATVEAFLTKEIKRVEKELGLHPDYEAEMNQISMDLD